MKRITNGPSELVAARVKLVRRGPQQATGRSLRLSTGDQNSPSASGASPEPARENPTAGMIGLLSRLQNLIARAGEQSRLAGSQRALLQQCIDKTVDAVECILAGASADSSRVSGELRAIDFHAIKSGGFRDLSRENLASVSAIVDRAVALLAPEPATDQQSPITDENAKAAQTAICDSEFAMIISQLTPAHVLAQSAPRPRHNSRTNSSGILEIDISE